MNKEQKLAWKKLADDRLRVTAIFTDHAAVTAKTIESLRDEYDKSYELVQVAVVTDPNTFEPVLLATIRDKTGKYLKRHVPILE